MTAETLLRDAQDAGLKFRLDGDRLKIAGEDGVVQYWAPKVRDHKPALIALLQCAQPNQRLLSEQGGGTGTTVAAAPDSAVPAAQQSWREADRHYQDHHWNCLQCRAANRGERCPFGAELWSRYLEAPDAQPEPKATSPITVDELDAKPSWMVTEPAATEVEIGLMTRRLERFEWLGLDVDKAERLVDRLVLRDRDEDDRRVCVECWHLSGSRRCANWRAAGIGGPEPGPDLLVQLQRCNGFTPLESPPEMPEPDLEPIDENGIATERIRQFIVKGLTRQDAEALADRLAKRALQDDRKVCFECVHLKGRRCENWQRAGLQVQDVSHGLWQIFQACDGFELDTGERE